MAKQKTTKPQEEKQTILDQSTTVEKIEVVEEKDNTSEVKQNTPIENKNKVSRIIQKRPSHYNLLMEDGRQVVVHKSLFDRDRMIVLQD